MLDINQQHENSLTITPFNSLDALKSIKCSKSSGVDGISAEHFVIAHSCIHVLLYPCYFLHLFYYTWLLAKYVRESGVK